MGCDSTWGSVFFQGEAANTVEVGGYLKVHHSVRVLQGNANHTNTLSIRSMIQLLHLIQLPSTSLISTQHMTASSNILRRCGHVILRDTSTALVEFKSRKLLHRVLMEGFLRRVHQKSLLWGFQFRMRLQLFYDVFVQILPEPLRILGFQLLLQTVLFLCIWKTLLPLSNLLCGSTY